MAGGGTLCNKKITNMKFTTILATLIIICFNLLGQNHFKTGNDFFQRGDYAKADSFLTLYVKDHPLDINARFNRGVSRLYLKDTCQFCMDLYKIINPYETDKQALKLYYTYCGNTDTIYFNKNFEVASKANYKYFEVFEHHKYFNFISGKIHDKRRKAEVTNIRLSQISSFRTNICAVYQIDSNNTKVYSICEYPPTFPGGSEELDKQISASQYFQQALISLNQTKVSVMVELTIDTIGRPIHADILNVRPPMDNIRELSQNVNMIYTNLPNFSPGKILIST